MKQDYKYHFNSEEVDLEYEQELSDDVLENKDEHIVQLDLKSNKDSVELDLETETSGELKLSLESNSRCVSVDTITPSPPGRRKKKSVTAKSEIIKFRCSFYEKKLLKIKAKRCGLTLSEYFRRVALEQKITERLTEEQSGIYKMLINYHNNFKSIGNMFRKRNPKLTEMVYGLANEIKSHLKNFKV